MGPAERLLAVALASALVVVSGASIVARVEEPLARFALSALVSFALFAILALGLASLRPLPPGGLARRLGLGPGVLPLRGVALLVLGTMALSNALEAAIALLGLEGIGTLAEMDAALAGADPLQVAFAAACLAAGAGVGEELFFRGLVQRSLEPRLGGAAAVVASAVLFGLAHTDRVHTPAAFALGLYLGSAAWLAGSVRASIACHVTNNALAVLGAAWGLRIPLAPRLVLAGGLAVAAAALVAAFRLRLRLVGRDHLASQQVADDQEGPQEGAPQQ